MTGPEHYREAERYLNAASGNDPERSTATLQVVLAIAQAHATLALAAAMTTPRIDGSIADPDPQDGAS